MSAPLREAMSRFALVAAGIVILAHAAWLAATASQLGDRAPDADDARGLVVLAGLLAGAAFLLFLVVGMKTRLAGRWLGLAILVGLVARLLPIPASPLLEDDFRRFLWDGAVTASGHSPYAWSPAEVAAGNAAVAADLVALASGASGIVSGVNHPTLRTVYPLFAQAVFAVAHVVAPFDASALRLAFLMFDIAALLLLLGILRSAGLPTVMVLWYWWNPLLIQQTYSAAHFDVLLGPLVLGALMAASRRRPALAATLLALACAAKAWPILLLPLVLRPAWPSRTLLVRGLAAFAGASALLWWPVIGSALDASSGFVAYGSRWESNDGAFRLALVLFYRLVAESPTLVSAAPVLVRAAVGIALVAFVAWRAFRPFVDELDLVRRGGACVAALFLLSPTQFPWYYAWLLPFLALAPRVSLLLLTVTLALYPLQWDHPRILWLEHLPVWIVLIAETAFPHRFRLGMGPSQPKEGGPPCGEAVASAS